MGAEQSPKRKVTFHTIADYCGLSIFTVSLALRGDQRILPATAERVRQAAAELGYDPAHNQSARRLALMRNGQPVLNNLVALYMPKDVEDTPYFNRLFWGVLNGVTHDGFALMVAMLPKNAEASTPDLMRLFRQGDIDGIIWPGDVTVSGHLEALQRTCPRDLPLISMIWPGADCGSVVADDEGGAAAATRHLLQLGHREILYLYQPATYISDQRIAGVRRAFAEAGLDPAHHLHLLNALSVQLMSSFPRKVAPAMLQGQRDDATATADFRAPLLSEWLRAHAGVTAILAWNDGNALHAWYALNNAGWRVPEDISLIGFDDTNSMPGPDGANLLTSVHVPLREIGEAAAHHLIRQIQGQATNEQLMLPTSLAIRASTAPPR